MTAAATTMTDPAAAPSRWTIGRLLPYGVTGLPLAALLLPLYVYLPSYYAEGLGLGFAAVGGVLLAARLWDGITDPLVGWLSDRWTSRWGRRRPWMVVGTPILLLGAWQLFRPGEGADWLHLLLWSGVLYLGATMVLLPYSAWGAELSPDYHERSRIAGAREIFVVVGTLLAASLPAITGGGAGAALSWLAWLLIGLLPLSVLITCSLVPERPTPPQRRVGWRQGLGILLGNRPFLRLVCAYLLNGIANGLPATLFLLYVEFGLGRPDWAGPLLLVYFVCGVAGVPLWTALSGRYGKHRVWVAAMLWACAAFVWVPLLGPGDTVWFLVICVLTGFSLGADLVLPPSMQADVVDMDTAESGTPRTGLYFALWGVATKLALALAVGLAFPLLDAAGFRSAGSAPDTGLFALVALYSLAPIAFKLAAIALMWGFPITAERQAEIRGRIEAAEREVKSA